MKGANEIHAPELVRAVILKRLNFGQNALSSREVEIYVDTLTAITDDDVEIVPAEAFAELKKRADYNARECVRLFDDRNVCLRALRSVLPVIEGTDLADKVRAVIVKCAP